MYQRRLHSTHGLGRGLSLSLLTAAAYGSPQAQLVGTQEAQIVHSVPSSFDLFGEALALSDNTLVVGCPYDGPSDVGSAWVFERSGKTWTQQAILQAPSPGADDRFGLRVAIDGDRLVVGAPLDDTTVGGNAGSVHVFDRMGGAWALSGTLTAELAGQPDDAAGDQFGIALAIDGDTLLVGSRFDDDGATDAGSVYVFVRSGGSWIVQAKLNGTPQPGALFGDAVDLDGNRAVVGARYENIPAGDQGAAYVFERNGGSWSQVAQLVDPSGSGGDEFGFSVAVSGDRVLVGARYKDGPSNAGAALTFTPFGGVWGFEQELRPETPVAGDEFGVSVDLEGDRALVGAWQQDTAGPNSGAAYVFERQGGTWLERERLIGCDQRGADDAGLDVALAGATAVVGARKHENAGSDHGVAYVFRLWTGAFERYGFGDGGAATCPCADSRVGMEQGCVNSTGFGARLSPRGSDSVAADDLRLAGCSFVPLAPALLFAGPNALNGAPFGDGLRVAGGPGLKRLGVRVPDARGNIEWGPGLISAAGWTAGLTRYFQAWYREPASPCMGAFNLSSGVAVTLQP